MNAITPKGWCPSLFDPMPAGDGLLVRVKPPGAVLTAAAASQLAAAAAAFGNGTIELTNRAHLQVRGLTAGGVAGFAAAMVAAGLAEAEPDRERRRAVIFPPLADSGLATEIEAIFATEPQLAGLPPKFAVAVDGGGLLPLGSVGADIFVVCTDVDCVIGLAGSSDAARVSVADAPAAARRLALAFLEYATRLTPAPRRMRPLVATLGAHRLFIAASLHATPRGPQPPAPRAIGWLAGAGAEQGAFGIGLPFGTMTAATLESLAGLAERFGDATLRLTPWRAFALPGIAAPDALAAAARQHGLIVQPDDPRLAIVTCAGRPGCGSASVDVRADAVLLLDLRLPGPLHLSGCAKGCAHPAAAPLTLVGEAGKYSIIRDGTAHDIASAHGLSMPEAVALLRTFL